MIDPDTNQACYACVPGQLANGIWGDELNLSAEERHGGMNAQVKTKLILAFVSAASLSIVACAGVPSACAQEGQPQLKPAIAAEHEHISGGNAKNGKDISEPSGDGQFIAAGDPKVGEVSESAQIAVPVSPSYVLGPGDLLLISDYSAADDGKPVEKETLVLPDGTATVHPMGAINVGGVTLEEINAFVNQAARSLFKHPDIQISVARPRPATFYVLGEVQHPGLIEEGVAGGGRRLGAGHAVVTLMGALKLAGGLTEFADVRHISIKRAAGKQAQTVDLWKLISDANPSSGTDVVLQPGDVVRVPRGGHAAGLQLGMAAPARVRVWGAVKKAGVYDISSADDVLTIIAKAGGFTDLANTRSVVLSRINSDGMLITRRINVRKAIRNRDSLGRTRVMPGDLLIVDNNALIKLAIAPTNLLGDVVEMVSDSVCAGRKRVSLPKKGTP